MNDSERRNAVREFLKSISFQQEIYKVDLETSGFHAIFDHFARSFEENLEEIMIGLVDRIKNIHNVLEMLNVFNCFLRKRTEHIYKRTDDQWAEVQRLLEGHFADLISKINLDDPDPEFFKLLESGESLMDKFITRRAAEALVGKAARVGGSLNSRLKKTV